MARNFVTTLPVPRTSLLGREREIASVRDLLRAQLVPLLTLIGPGGVGKTRLALAVATELESEFGDGVIFIPLAPVREAALVLPEIARTLGLRESPLVPLAGALADMLREQHLLLVLDNLEHVVSVTPALAHLLEACPRLQILATSRVRLHLGAEHLYPVSPLPVPVLEPKLNQPMVAANPAAALFAQRAQQVHPGFTLTDGNAASVAAIVRHLDGLPLAVELAAARASVLTPEALLAQLSRRLRLLTGGPADAPLRLQSMTDTIAWSYDLLESPHQALFRRMSVFVDGFDAEPAITVAGQDAVDTLDGVRALVDQSLVLTSDVPGRFSMLETVREFGLARLVETGEETAARSAHAAWIVTLVEAARPHLLGPHERLWGDRLDANLGNLRAALTWTLVHTPATTLQIVSATQLYWGLRLPTSEGRRWLELALQATPVDAPFRSQTLAAASLIANLQGDVAASQAHAAAALKRSEETGETVTAGWARSQLAACTFFTGEPQTAIQLLDTALTELETGERDTDRAWNAYTRAWRGLAAAMLGDIDQGLADYQVALSQARAIGSDRITLFILDDFAGLLVDAGHLDRARYLAAEALRIATLVEELWLVAHAVLAWSYIDAAAGDAVRAARGLGAAEALYAKVGLKMPQPQQQRTDRAVRMAEDVLGTTVFAAEKAAGRDHPIAVITSTLQQTPVDAALPLTSTAFGLSPRETDVLRLLSVGMTDRQIAAALFVSRKTASNHVTSILRKLGVETRAAAASSAVRAGLA